MSPLDPVANGPMAIAVVEAVLRDRTGLTANERSFLGEVMLDAIDRYATVTRRQPGPIRHLLPRIAFPRWSAAALTDDGTPFGDEVYGRAFCFQWFGILVEIGAGRVRGDV